MGLSQFCAVSVRPRCLGSPPCKGVRFSRCHPPSAQWYPGRAAMPGQKFPCQKSARLPAPQLPRGSAGSTLPALLLCNWPEKPFRISQSDGAGCAQCPVRSGSGRKPASDTIPASGKTTPFIHARLILQNHALQNMPFETHPRFKRHALFPCGEANRALLFVDSAAPCDAITTQ